jgi:hypothetical protein
VNGTNDEPVPSTTQKLSLQLGTETAPRLDKKNHAFTFSSFFCPSHTRSSQLHHWQICLKAFHRASTRQIRANSSLLQKEFCPCLRLSFSLLTQTCDWTFRSTHRLRNHILQLARFTTLKAFSTPYLLSTLLKSDAYTRYNAFFPEEAQVLEDGLRYHCAKSDLCSSNRIPNDNARRPSSPS